MCTSRNVDKHEGGQEGLWTSTYVDKTECGQEGMWTRNVDRMECGKKGIQTSRNVDKKECGQAERWTKGNADRQMALHLPSSLSLSLLIRDNLRAPPTSSFTRAKNYNL